MLFLLALEDPGKYNEKIFFSPEKNVLNFLNTYIWDKIFTRRPRKICSRQILKNLTW